MNDRRIKRVNALRLRGQWTASADDGVRIGNGAGYSWEAAVREAIQEVDAKYVKDETEPRS